MASAEFHHDHTAKLVRMANQIGTFFDSQPPEQTVAGIADHIRRFWDKRMRRDIYAHLEAGGAGLLPSVVDALRQMRPTETSL